jgi:hypothetical protein
LLSTAPEDAAAAGVSSPVSSGCEKSHSIARSALPPYASPVSARRIPREAEAHRLLQRLARLRGREAHVRERRDLPRVRLGLRAARRRERRVDICVPRQPPPSVEDGVRTGVVHVREEPLHRGLRARVARREQRLRAPRRGEAHALELRERVRVDRRCSCVGLGQERLARLRAAAEVRV